MEYRQDGRFVFCPTARGTLGVEVVAPGILRVFLGEEARNYVSKAVEADLHEACPFMVTGAGEGCAVSTPLLRLEIDPQDQEILVLHADASEDAELLARLLREAIPGLKGVRVQILGPVIGSHCGPGTLASCFMGKERPQ